MRHEQTGIGLEAIADLLKVFLASLCLLGGSTLGDTEEAVIEVTGVDSQEEVEQSDSLSGCLASAGAFSSAKGDAVRLKPCQGSESKPHLHPHGWIAVIDIVDAVAGKGEDGTCSLLEQASRAILWGAAAVLLLSDTWAGVNEFKSEQKVHRPVVVLLEREASKLRAMLVDRRWNTVGLQIYSKSSVLAHPVSRVTLWTTCGRPVGRFAGTVCPGKQVETYSSPVNFTSASVLLTLFLSFFLLILRMRMAQSHSREEEVRLEISLANLAKGVVSKLPTKRHTALRFTKIGEKERNSAARDACAILDDYYFQQVLRLLPCGHSFHKLCVDPWLIAKRTCPLCKYNILGKQRRSYETINLTGLIESLCKEKIVDNF
eukprot:m.197955 g.197955  ORF g.197955 m.197955 type:complete len:374 (+) comp39551_c1_seq1:276-1397(+)